MQLHHQSWNVFYHTLVIKKKKNLDWPWDLVWSRPFDQALSDSSKTKVFPLFIVKSFLLWPLSPLKRTWRCNYLHGVWEWWHLRCNLNEVRALSPAGLLRRARYQRRGPKVQSSRGGKCKQRQLIWLFLNPPLAWRIGHDRTPKPLALGLACRQPPLDQVRQTAQTGQPWDKAWTRWIEFVSRGPAEERRLRSVSADVRTVSLQHRPPEACRIVFAEKKRWLIEF